MIYGLIGFFSGIISGMGIGGGVLLIPALLFFTEWSQQQAQAANLLFFLPTACAALLKHKKEHTVELATAKAVLPWGLTAAAVGAMVAVWVEGEVLRLLFGIFLAVMGVLEIWGAKKNAKAEGQEQKSGKDMGKFKKL